LRKPILRVRYSDDIPDANLRLIAATKNFHLFPECVRRSVMTVSDNQAVIKAITEKGMIGALEEMDLEGDDAEQIRADTKAFLTTVKPADLIEDFLANKVPVCSSKKSTSSTTARTKK
jgi:hypothetical protein